MPAVKWVEAKCVVCGGQFEYAEGGYEPKTCARFECVQKHFHPELRRQAMTVFELEEVKENW